VWLRTLELPAFEHASPRHLQIADLFGPTGGKYLVCHTALGEILAIDQAFGIAYQYSEPGIVDLLVDTQHDVVGENLSRPIFIQSERGHVARLCLGPTATEARLLGATVPLIGNPGGLCLEPSGNLAAVSFDVIEEGDYPPQTGFHVHQISTSTTAAPGGNMTLLQSRFVTYQPDTGYGFERDFACLGSDFLILKGGRLYKLPTGAGTSPSWVELSKFAPAVFPCDFVIGELDGDAGAEIVLSSEGGQLVWFDADVDPWGLPAYTPSSDDRTSASLVATWGMTHDGSDLQVADQSARRWKVDPATGAVMFEELFSLDTATPAVPMKKPVRGLGRLENPVALPPTTVFASSDSLSPAGIPSGLQFQADVYFPHVVNVPFVVLPPLFTPAPEWDTMGHQQLFAGLYVPFSYAGDTLSAVGKEHVFWWSGNRPVPRFFSGYPNLPIAIRYLNLLQGGTHVLANPPQQPQPTFYHWSSSSQGTALHLRNVTDTESHNHQALRLGTWSTLENHPVVVVTATGGSVLVVDPGAFPHSGDGSVRGESEDYGYGGMALCVTQVSVPGLQTTEPMIFFAPLWAHAGTGAQADMVSSLAILERTTLNHTTLPEVQPRRFFDAAPKLFGVCGIAVGDVDDGSTGGDAHDELVLTTVNGDLVVFDLALVGGKVGLGPLLHWSVHDGSLGVCNSIVIAGLDGAIEGNEVYVAGSNGIRKFTRQVNP
jgi:hypothetical protein